MKSISSTCDDCYTFIIFKIYYILYLFSFDKEKLIISLKFKEVLTHTINTVKDVKKTSIYFQSIFYSFNV